ncbi:hypothetical protein [Chryseobacterium profundimaris]|uniref:Uncharacterized protein n=1 Tax=Chryseobacterium profundimaris TaxID=1387275 RepID=A0ABY1P9V4_9FLAO|nr:hypothetical protein [Chryseobacterium profundimaris]SMP29256.1 hypothetical protein SAMN06264346_11197 [Chryseobacterium profundimaris]
MELPLYLSFNEFENRYYDNLEKWFEEYRNTSETDYLKALAEMYSPYLYYNFANDRVQADATIQIKECSFPHHDKIGISFCTNCENGKVQKSTQNMTPIFDWKTISMMEYAQHILDKINRHLQSCIDKAGQNVLDYINDYQIITSRDGAEYCVNYNQHQLTLPFLKAYLPVYGQTVNISIYRDFLYSLVKIAEFIDKKLKEVHAFESAIYSKLKSDAKFRVQMSHHFLTICN